MFRKGYEAEFYSSKIISLKRRNSRYGSRVGTARVGTVWQALASRRSHDPLHHVVRLVSLDPHCRCAHARGADGVMGVSPSRVQPIRDFGLREASLGTTLARLCCAMLAELHSLREAARHSVGSREQGICLCVPCLRGVTAPSATAVNRCPRAPIVGDIFFHGPDRRQGRWWRG